MAYIKIGPGLLSPHTSHQGSYKKAALKGPNTVPMEAFQKKFEREVTNEVKRENKKRTAQRVESKVPELKGKIGNMYSKKGYPFWVQDTEESRRAFDLHALSMNLDEKRQFLICGGCGKSLDLRMADVDEDTANFAFCNFTCIEFRKCNRNKFHLY